MNDYETRRAARIERMRARAATQDALAESSAAKAHGIADGIPAGQPILVGHHSERRHRRDLARMDSAMRTSVEASREAEDLRRRADRAEVSTAVSSDDPEAIAKLSAQLADETDATRARYLRDRIAQLQAKAAAPPKPPERIGDVTISEADNRVRVEFPGKPSPEVIAELKRHGFRWSPTNGAWQRHASNQAWYWARSIAGMTVTP